jgi:hypothetical protein
VLWRGTGERIFFTTHKTAYAEVESRIPNLDLLTTMMLPTELQLRPQIEVIDNS